MKKRILSSFLSLVLVLSLMPVSALAAEGPQNVAPAVVTEEPGEVHGEPPVEEAAGPEEPACINIDQNNIQSEVMNSDKPVLLDFWAPWCGPCRMVVPIVEEIARERNDIKVGKVNVDEQPELASRFGVVSIPTLVVMKNGKIVDQAIGARPKNAILGML